MSTIPRRTSLICPNCGVTFERFNAHVRGRIICCSRKCSAALRPKRSKTMLQYTCLHCGTSFLRRKGYSGKKKYCSQQCSSLATTPKGANHFRWKGGIADRSHASRLIIKRLIKEIGRCQRCGSTEYLQGHHRKLVSDYPELEKDPSNIEIICSECHGKEHPQWQNMIVIPRKRSGVTITCQVCGTPRYVPPHLKDTAKFCSRECQRTALHESLRGRRHRSSSPRQRESTGTLPLPFAEWSPSLREKRAETPAPKRS